MANNISVAEEIAKLKVLVDKGIITQKEFDEQKRSLLNGNQNNSQSQQNQSMQPNIIINNNVVSKNVNKNVVDGGRSRRHKSSLGFDIFMIFITGGLWIIWMILRPKYY